MECYKGLTKFCLYMSPDSYVKYLPIAIVARVTLPSLMHGQVPVTRGGELGPGKASSCFPGDLIKPRTLTRLVKKTLFYIKGRRSQKIFPKLRAAWSCFIYFNK